jgi:hypothetical protein
MQGFEGRKSYICPKCNKRHEFRLVDLWEGYNSSVNPFNLIIPNDYIIKFDCGHTFKFGKICYRITDGKVMHIHWKNLQIGV